MREIDGRLREVRAELHGLSRRERRRVLAEARDHLLSSLEDGCDERQAVERLGTERAFRGFPPRFDPALPAPTPAQAAPPAFPPQGAGDQRCAAAWNAPANA